MRKSGDRDKNSHTQFRKLANPLTYAPKPDPFFSLPLGRMESKKFKTVRAFILALTHQTQ